MYIGVSCPERATINKFEVVRGRLFPMHSPQMPVMVARTIQPKGSSKEEMIQVNKRGFNQGRHKHRRNK